MSLICKKMFYFLLVASMMAASLAFCEDDIERAFTKYTEGERADTVEARKKAFNEALTIYLELSNKHPTGKLYYNIGNTYFQLGEYGLAIFYYYKAQEEMPRNTSVRGNLRVALAKAGLSYQAPSQMMDYLLFFHRELSTHEKTILVIALLFFAFTLFSIHIWLPHSFFRRLGTVSAIIALVLLLSLLWVQYFAPLDAVVVRSCQLRKSAGTEYAELKSTPCLAGTRVRVLQVTQEGSWLKIRHPSGEEGYVSKENARVL